MRFGKTPMSRFKFAVIFGCGVWGLLSATIFLLIQIVVLYNIKDGVNNGIIKRK
ncbi:hypothetical protein FACS189483_05110 [Spirochaetia bacterium]|nr:hypothetical protein FACS189483_05110 [Spirochaetia bacterium]